MILNIDRWIGRFGLETTFRGPRRTLLPQKFHCHVAAAHRCRGIVHLQFRLQTLKREMRGDGSN